MVTHVFNKLLPLLFNMNPSIGHHSLSCMYTNSFCVGMLQDFDTCNPSLGFLNSPDYRNHLASLNQVVLKLAFLSSS